jgi:hypothetical protein
MNRKTVQSKRIDAADLADRILTGEGAGGAELPDDPGIRKTLEALAKARPQTRTDPEMQKRIQAKLQADWNASGRRPAWHPTWQAYAVGLAALVVFVLVLVFNTPGSGGTQSATAQDPTIAVLVLGCVVLLVIGFILWRLRRGSNGRRPKK